MDGKVVKERFILFEVPVLTTMLRQEKALEKFSRTEIRKDKVWEEIFSEKAKVAEPMRTIVLKVCGYWDCNYVAALVGLTRPEYKVEHFRQIVKQMRSWGGTFEFVTKEYVEAHFIRACNEFFPKYSAIYTYKGNYGVYYDWKGRKGSRKFYCFVQRRRNGTYVVTPDTAEPLEGMSLGRCVIKETDIVEFYRNLDGSPVSLSLILTE